MIESLLLAVVAFASTNVDDAFVLLAFYGDPKFRTLQVVIGQYIGMTTLTVIGLAVAFAALALPTGYIGYLGLLPILVGARRLILAIRERSAQDGCQAKFEAHGRAIASVASVTIANGGDNVGTYAPLFARQDNINIALMCGIFIVMTGIWCIVGKLLVSHPVLGLHIRRWGHQIVPFILMGIGGYILYRNGILPQL